MKVAIVHDYIKEYGGAERVLESLHEIWPDAPVYSTVFLPDFLGPHKARFKSWKIKTSFLQLLPFKEKLISPIRIVAPFVFRTFDFSKFDLVIVSATGAYSPNVIDSKSAVQICYCHTPPRYLYGFATAREWKNNLIFRVLGELANHFLRLVDYKSFQNVDFFIANSKNVKGRIEKFYKKDAVVIYPPVEIVSAEVAPSEQGSPRSYFLAGGRIARPKNIELIIKTFEKLKLPLKIFGRSFGGLNMTISKYPSIEYLEEISDGEKLELMRNAKAFIFASEDEDFGIIPVEAMSVGTPVIAYRSGGVIESVLQGRTGIFFDELTVESLSKAIKQFSSSKINLEDCIAQAQKFSKERFKKEIKDFIERVVK